MSATAIIYEQFETSDDDWIMIEVAKKSVAPAPRLSFLEVLLKQVHNADSILEGNSEILPKKSFHIETPNKRKKDVSGAANVVSDFGMIAPHFLKYNLLMFIFF